MRSHRLLAVALIPLLALSCAESDEEEKEKKEAAAAFNADCVLKPADAAAALPADVPAGVNGATFYQLDAQGSTKRYFAYTAGSEVVTVRDSIRTAYEQAGFEIENSDAEPPAEAEFEWRKGSIEGSVQVVPLCRDTVRVRYRVGPA